MIPLPRIRALLALIASGVVLVSACGPTSAPSATRTEATSGTTSPSSSPSPSPSPITGLTWGRADAVERPQIAFELPSGPPPSGPSGPGTAGHPGHFPGQSIVQGLAVGPDSLVAIGSTYPGWTPTAWRSTDARHWQLVAMGAETATFPVAITTGAQGELVAVGRSDRIAVAWTSTDGLGWAMHKLPVDSATSERAWAVLPYGDGYLAGGSIGPEIGERHARFWRSEDGASWRAVADDPAFEGAEIRDIVDTPRGFVALATTGPGERPTGSVAFVSRDGDMWTRVDDPSLAAGLVAGATVGPHQQIVAVGTTPQQDEAVVWSSDVGTSWQRQPAEYSRDGLGGKVLMTAVARWADSLVAVGESNALQYPDARIWTSADVRTWSTAPRQPILNQGEMTAVAPFRDGLVAVGTFGAPDDSIPQVWLSPPSLGG